MKQNTVVTTWLIGMGVVALGLFISAITFDWGGFDKEECRGNAIERSQSIGLTFQGHLPGSDYQFIATSNDGTVYYIETKNISNCEISTFSVITD